jgi:hypothetical protein
VGPTVAAAVHRARTEVLAGAAGIAAAAVEVTDTGDLLCVTRTPPAGGVFCWLRFRRKEFSSIAI